MATETGTEASTVVYVVRTPVKNYNGVTAGVVFRDGAAAILTSEHGLSPEEATEKARELQEDFGYDVSPRVPRPVATPDFSDKYNAPRAKHPIEDQRVAPFYPRDPDLPAGADPGIAIPKMSRTIRETETVTTIETETPDGEDSEGR